jgi:HD-GYP domain-containing protein (c-di-GMP phosphodiesterase class II)
VRVSAPVAVKERAAAADLWDMRKSRSLARTGRPPYGAPGRRLDACPHPSVRRGDSPDRLTRELADRVPRMKGHHRAVAEMAAAVARHIGLTGERLHAVVRAAELHDVGKVLVPDAILNKPGSLDRAELELMRRHAIAGYLILAESAEPAPIAALVRSSHERWDGTGYPDGLSGEDIPLGSRVITICDAYDAMTHARPYRPARPIADALSELRAGAGVRYDPCLVDVFFDVVGARAPRA